MPIANEHTRPLAAAALLLSVLLLTGPSTVQAQFTYIITPDDTIAITGYTGPGGIVAIPSTISNVPVTDIALDAFQGTPVTSVTIPDSVITIEDFAFQDCSSLTNLLIENGSLTIGEEAFSYCVNLTNVFFTGDAPDFGFDVFAADDNATAYYLPGTYGWSNNVANLPALLWNPVIQTADGSFGVNNNQFGFNITGTANIPIVIEACVNLSNPLWLPLQAVTLTNGLYYFSEPLQTNGTTHFYQISAP